MASSETLLHSKKTLHSKRSFGRYPKHIDSPAYDASEEDNDPLTDDAASLISIPSSRNPPANPLPNSSTRNTHLKTATARTRQHQLASTLISDSSDGVDSPTYDGDIESSTTAGADSHPSTRHMHAQQPQHHQHQHSSSASTIDIPNTPAFPGSPTPSNGIPPVRDSQNPVFISQPTTAPEEPAVAQASKEAFDPAALTPEDIRAFVQKAIEGESWRTYRINPPPVDRPIRIYADGVYDLFHFGHALQLRQAKLSFPSVYLLVGVCSDELVKSHKARSIMSHAERCEAARHCRWVDEVIPAAPWVIDAAFLADHQIDYVAHDEEPYAAEGHEDVYSFVKSLGKFIPTRRTPGVSTSSLLERIVLGYRHRDFDEKLVKMGHAELKAEGSDWDGSVAGSRVGSTRGSANGSRSISPVRNGSGNSNGNGVKK